MERSRASSSFGAVSVARKVVVTVLTAFNRRLESDEAAGENHRSRPPVTSLVESKLCSPRGIFDSASINSIDASQIIPSHLDGHVDTGPEE
jgi:hypothetical protein